MAMSAATMIACAADEIVMGKHSFIGPIDPQLQLQTALGVRFAPAQAIIDQFDLAKTQAADPVTLRAWLPMLSQYGPDLLITCTNATKLAKMLVTNWLTSNMFKGDPDAAQKATAIGDWLADHSHFMTHGRPISRDTAEQKGLKIVRLEDDQALQDAVLSVYHATAHTFTQTGAVKIIENHLGRAYLEVMQQMMVIGGQQPGRRPLSHKGHSVKWGSMMSVQRISGVPALSAGGLSVNRTRPDKGGGFGLAASIPFMRPVANRLRRRQKPMFF